MGNMNSILKILDILGMNNDESFKDEIRKVIKEKVIDIVIDNITYEVEQWCHYNFSRPDTGFFEDCFEEAENKCRKQIVSKYKELLLNAEINLKENDSNDNIVKDNSLSSKINMLDYIKK